MKTSKIQSKDIAADKSVNSTFTSYRPEVPTYILCGNNDLLKIDQIIIMNDSGKISLKSINYNSIGSRWVFNNAGDNEDYLRAVFSTPVAPNVIDEGSVLYYASHFETEDMTQDIKDNLLDWGIDTVLCEDGSKMPLKVFLETTFSIIL